MYPYKAFDGEPAARFAPTIYTYSIVCINKQV